MSRVLLDSNIVIYSVETDGVIAREFIAANKFCCSVVSMVETLGFKGISDHDDAVLRGFFSRCVVLPVIGEVVTTAIDLRRRRRMKLGDSLIASTAIVHELAIATRNVDDFAWIEELKVVNPYAAA